MPGGNKKVTYLSKPTAFSKSVSSDYYKAFVTHHLDYVDVIYDKPDNESFKDWLEKVQYNAVLAVTCAIRYRAYS